jgi:hypothetical protein
MAKNCGKMFDEMRGELVLMQYAHLSSEHLNRDAKNSF